jgi:hypothetical protein
MATIKAGTYRFHDVPTKASFYNEAHFDFHTVAIVNGESYKLYCKTIYQDVNEPYDTASLQYIAVSSVPDLSELGFTFPFGRYVYDGSTKEWRTDLYGEGIQTITIPEDTDVSDEFGTWFAENAKPCISGVWKLKNFEDINFPTDNISQDVDFTITCGSALGMDVTLYCSRYFVPSSVHKEIDILIESSNPDLSDYGMTYPNVTIISTVSGWRNEDFGLTSDPDTLDFGTELQPVSAEFYEWLTANAVQPVATVTYNGSTIATLFGVQTATLKCSGMTMESDVVVDVAEQSGGGGETIEEYDGTIIIE